MGSWLAANVGEILMERMECIIENDGERKNEKEI
jgi:hypothetical protein